MIKIDKGVTEVVQMPREALVTKTLVELADSLVEDFDVVEVLTLLTDRCVEVLDVAAAGLMLAAPGEGLQVLASSSDAMRLLELFELQAKEGPCLDCYQTGTPLLDHALDNDSGMWPTFTARATAAGFRSVSALPMSLRGMRIGALNLFRTETRPMAEADSIVARALADVATIAILQHRAGTEAQVVNEQLTLALKSRIVIEQAKGVVAEQSGLNVEQAFSRMRHHARNHNLRLADLSKSIIDRVTTAASLDPLTKPTADARPR